MPCGAARLLQIPYDGRCGVPNEGGVLVTSVELLPIGDDGENFEARLSAAAVRKALSSALKATPDRRQSTSPLQYELRELISGLSQRMDAIEQPLSDLHPASKRSVQVGTRTAPTLLGSVTKQAGGSASDRAQELLGGPMNSHIPVGLPAKFLITQSLTSLVPVAGMAAALTSSLGRIAAAPKRGRTPSLLEAGFVSREAAAWSEEEFAGTIADGAGTGIKMGRCALLGRVRNTRKVPPEIIRTADVNAVKKDREWCLAKLGSRPDIATRWYSLTATSFGP